jgi:hypothetical protein
VAVTLGYKNVYRDPYGFPQWQAQGLPSADSPAGLSAPFQAAGRLTAAQSLQGWAMLWTLLGVFAGGLALNLTPCVYPMIPITGKILYLDAPVPGAVQFNRAIREKPSRIAIDPYDQGWLFRIQPQGGVERPYQVLASPQAYLENLHRSEGLKNPEGIKGGVSGICKAVYTGIGEQKI